MWYFVNTFEWLEFMKNMDLTVGTRFHGCVASALSGIPYFVIPLDSRMKELAEYHNMFRIYPDEIEGNKDVKLEDFILKMDVASFMRTHESNLKHYREFLKNNGVDNIFEHGLLKRGDAPIDHLNLVNRNRYCLNSFESCDFPTQVKRTVYKGYRAIIEDFNMTKYKFKRILSKV